MGTDAARALADAGGLLVTGFGPFPGVADNPSGRFAASVDGARVDGVAVAGRVIPVEWGRAWPAVRAAVEALRPAALLMYGVAVQRQRVEVERLARNVAGRRPDAVGALPPHARLVPDGPAALPTTLPWRDLVGPAVGVSDDAGDYLCNAVTFHAMHALGERLRFCGFVHIPPSPTPGVRAVLVRLAGVMARASV